MLLGSMAFAIMSTMAHALGSSCDWQIIALARSSLALLFAAILALSAGVRLVLWRPRTLWLRSIAGSCSLIGTFFALTRLPVSDVLTLTNTFPIWVALLSWPLLGEPPSARVWFAVSVAWPVSSSSNGRISPRETSPRSSRWGARYRQPLP